MKTLGKTAVFKTSMTIAKLTRFFVIDLYLKFIKKNKLKTA